MLKADGAVGAQKSESSFIHTTYVYLVDKRLRVRGIYDSASPKAMAQLTEDKAKVLGIQSLDSGFPGEWNLSHEGRKKIFDHE